MSKKQLIVGWGVLPFLALSLLLSYPFSYAGDLSAEGIKVIREGVPECIYLTYDEYKDSLKFVKEALDRWEKGEKYDPDLDYNYIGLPNSLSFLEGYGLKAQRDIARLELENAKLKRESKVRIANLESKLIEAEKQFKYFSEHNNWVD